MLGRLRCGAVAVGVADVNYPLRESCMYDDVLNRYASRLGARAGEPDVAELDAGDDLGCFGWLRGGRDRAVSLVLRKKSGSSLALSYAFIERIEIDPLSGITIAAGRTTVRVQGRSLNREVRPMVRRFDGIDAMPGALGPGG